MLNKLISLMLATVLSFPAWSLPPLFIVSSEEAPFQYTENGNLKGLSIEILREVLYEAGYQGTEIKILPWPRAYRMALRNRNTLILSLRRTKGREGLFHWTLPLFENLSTLYRLNTREDIHIKHENDLKKYRIGVLRDSLWHQYLVSRGFTNLELISNDELNIRKLFAGRIDLYVNNPLVLQFRMTQAWGYSKEDFEALVPVYQLEETRGMTYMAFSLNTDEPLRNLFITSFEKVKASGKFQEILGKYGLD